ncbi:MAG: hypothetical protein ACETWK_13340, partial [Candidatus Aminicenantaceae bacterium]
MSKLIFQSSNLLKKMFDEERCLFAYSTQLNNEKYVNEFSHPAVYRYTINTLAGIHQANKFYSIDWDFNKILDRFLSLHSKNITNEGDKGLLLYVLSLANHESRHVQFSDLESIATDRDKLLSLNAQDISWILLGLTKYAEQQKDTRAASTAEKTFRVLNRHFFNKDTLLPFHALSRYRKKFVNFGTITHFLASLHEYSKVFNDKYAETIFLESTRQLISLQGERGEWPWFINAYNAQVFDWYQIYSVHQNSMAMLFLLPALDLGINEAETAISKSYRWLFGQNELRTPMITHQPFFIYRSIRRKGNLKYDRGKRYLRSLIRSSIMNKPAKKINSSQLEINKECRSYHLGWLLFVWA